MLRQLGVHIGKQANKQKHLNWMFTSHIQKINNSQIIINLNVKSKEHRRIYFWLWDSKRFLKQDTKITNDKRKGLIKWATLKIITYFHLGFSCGSAGKESTCNAGDLGSMPALGRAPGEGKGYLLQYSDLDNSMDCIVHGVAKSQIQLNDFHLFSPRNTINCAKVNYRMGKDIFSSFKTIKDFISRL